MQETLFVFVFPAFTSDLKDPPGKAIPGFNDHYQYLLETAVGAGFSGLPDVLAGNPAPNNDELNAQYASYLFSCAVSCALRENRLTPVVSSGYSMGIYAALFDSGSITFTEGLYLIRNAYRSLLMGLHQIPAGMIIVIGLSREDLEEIISQKQLHCRIANENAPFSFSLSGRLSDLQSLSGLALAEGALHVRFLDVSVPYHSEYAESGAREFQEEISAVAFRKPAHPILSLIDQSALTETETLRSETVRNLFTPLNWHQTLLKLKTMNPGYCMIECGLSTGLPRNSKFINGSLPFYALQDFWDSYVNRR